jgi:hypothetical protein
MALARKPCVDRVTQQANGRNARAGVVFAAGRGLQERNAANRVLKAPFPLPPTTSHRIHQQSRAASRRPRFSVFASDSGYRFDTYTMYSQVPPCAGPGYHRALLHCLCRSRCPAPHRNPAGNRDGFGPRPLRRPQSDQKRCNRLPTLAPTSIGVCTVPCFGFRALVQE